jgi:hypothetical protein
VHSGRVAETDEGPIEETLDRLRDDPLRRLVRALEGDPPATYLHTRNLIARGLCLIYLCAFAVVVTQATALLGEHGLLPARWHLTDVAAHHGSAWAGFLARPSLFWLDAGDGSILAAGWLGVVLSLAGLAGLSHPALFFALWLLQLSFVHVGQVFWGYGWETLLLEAGFLAVFLYPLRGWRPLDRSPPPLATLWLYRWLLFRVMFGAGLIKLRGDDCWVELTCLHHHFETQPIPNPLTPFFHGLPGWVLKGGVLFNHLVEVLVPFFYFGPRRLRAAAGLLTIAFQGVLILSGNLSWLNWLTLVVAIACFDDRTFGKLVPERWPSSGEEPSRAHRRTVWALVVVVALLSIGPVVNLFSPRQRMNASFDRLHLVNSYGAFGTVGRTRHEVVLEGTLDDPTDPNAEWRAYELPCKPGDPDRTPCVISPFHRRLDWQLWFAALGDYEREPWIVRLAHLLLEGRREPLALFEGDPFEGATPRAIRARRFRYALADGDAVWEREPVGEYLKPLTLGDPDMRAFLSAYGLLRSER